MDSAQCSKNVKFWRLVKEASFKSSGVICFPEMLPAIPEPQNTNSKRIHTNVAMILLFVILTKNALFKSYGAFTYLLRVHICDISVVIYLHNQCI